jgi:uncharacterized protein DUF6600/FecR-like protein
MSKPKLPRLLILTPLVLSLFALPCWADSQARVVRLSDVQGDVRIDRNTGGGYEKAFLNLPITQGMKVRTLDDGRAALELEDGSTVRLTPNTILEVPRLSLSDAGTKLSGFRLLDGTAYINFLGAKDAEVDFTFAREKLVLTSATHLRVDMADTDAVVAVFKGDVEIAGPEGTVQVAKNHKASFDLIEDKYKVARNLDDAPYDAWDKQQDQYQQRYSDNSYSQYSPYAYGTSDLNYYGSFFNAPGYGMLWQPYFVGAGWDPFMNGAWAFYPGVGYGWVSAYPWGWTPYHYGSWLFVPGYGWAWQPGGAWTGWNTMPVILNAPVGYLPPRTPALPGKRIFPVNNGPAPTMIARSKVQIPPNSAGLGIPRGSIQNLGALSHTVAQQGTVTTRLPATSVRGSSWAHGGYDAPSFPAGGSHISAAPATSSGHSSSGHASSGHH